MQQGYFRTAWNDIKNSPKWFSKMLIMALLMFVPILGPIVIAGYFYGWARDIAWGVHAPLPSRIFGNEDGRLYSRGFFVYVITFVFGLIPGILQTVLLIVFGVGTGSLIGGGSYGGFALFSVILGLIYGVVSFAVYFAVIFFSWVGGMRMSVYGRLSAGFQFGKIWAMIRKDFWGLLRIFAMMLICGLVVGLVVGLVMSLAIIIPLTVGIAGTGGNLHADSLSGGVIAWIIALGGIAVLLLLVVGYITGVCSVIIQALVVRALGYWTRQFDVPAWRGQDDPMPFQLQQQPPVQAPPPYQQ